jgi:regulator of protease activity HflC (stomatin/prohibitin superfamily)
VNSIANLFAQFGEYIGRLWPLAIVLPWEQGVRLFAGNITRLLTHENGWRGTGLHVHWPVIGDVFKLESNVEVFETQPQTVRTLDGKEVTFTLGLQCRIHRLDLFYAQVNDDLKETVADAVRSVAGETALTRTAAELGVEWSQTVRDLAATRMQGWGVKLLRVSIITMTQSAALRIIGSHLVL